MEALAVIFTFLGQTCHIRLIFFLIHDFALFLGQRLPQIFIIEIRPLNFLLDLPNCSLVSLKVGGQCLLSTFARGDLRFERFQLIIFSVKTIFELRVLLSNSINIFHPALGIQLDLKLIAPFLDISKLSSPNKFLLHCKLRVDYL